VQVPVSADGSDEQDEGMPFDAFGAWSGYEGTALGYSSLEQQILQLTLQQLSFTQAANEELRKQIDEFEQHGLDMHEMHRDEVQKLTRKANRLTERAEQAEEELDDLRQDIRQKILHRNKIAKLSYHRIQARKSEERDAQRKMEAKQTRQIHEASDPEDYDETWEPPVKGAGKGNDMGSGASSSGLAQVFCEPILSPKTFSTYESASWY
jgi:hypothetical protein